jgi:hypothetical protein
VLAGFLTRLRGLWWTQPAAVAKEKIHSRLGETDLHFVEQLYVLVFPPRLEVAHSALGSIEWLRKHEDRLVDIETDECRHLARFCKALAAGLYGVRRCSRLPSQLKATEDPRRASILGDCHEALRISVDFKSKNPDSRQSSSDERMLTLEVALSVLLVCLPRRWWY